MDKSNNLIRQKEKDLIKEMILISGEKICIFLNIESNRYKELVDNFVVESKSFGHNYDVFFISFYDTKKVLLSTVCLKSSFKREDKLETESTILNLLKANNIRCPKIINSGHNKKEESFILMEAINTKNMHDCIVDIRASEEVLNTIQQHELVLTNNVNLLKFFKYNLNSHKKIDFKEKLVSFLKEYIPKFKIKESLAFLNYHLNKPDFIKRTIITDRSIDNVFFDNNNQITMIDFSMIRIGTQFDNWIQFTQDPRARFSCSQEELIKLFFKKNNLSKSKLNFYYVSSIYTNLLQGIFTYQKNQELSKKYIDNVNDIFMKFRKRKGVLIDIGY